MPAGGSDDLIAESIATVLVDGFNKHYRLFSESSAQAKPRFESGDWLGVQRAVRERIALAKGAEAAANLPPDTLMNPDSIAETYWQLHCQRRDAWTHELDLRPYGENW